MVYLKGGERVSVKTEDWEGYGVVQPISEPKSTEVDNGEYIPLKVDPEDVIEGDVDTSGTVTVKSSDVVGVHD